MIKLLLKLKDHPLSDIPEYLIGTYRQWAYDNYRFLLRKHILEQYQKRIQAAKECYFNGECICCGCETPALFMANKGCQAPKYCEGKKACYPAMMDSVTWDVFKLIEKANKNGKNNTN
jgi:hypothetical protein